MFRKVEKRKRNGSHCRLLWELGEQAGLTVSSVQEDSDESLEQ